MRRGRRIAMLAVAVLAACAVPVQAHTLSLRRAATKARQYAAYIAHGVGATGSGVTGCHRFNSHVVYCQYYIDGLYPEAKGPVRCLVPLRVSYANNRSFVMHVHVPPDPPVDCTSPAGPSPPLPPPPD
jgi:hypothetical protein